MGVDEIDWSERVEDQDAITIGHKIVEMAEKLKFCPGARATWTFEMDGERYNVDVTAAETE